MSTMVERVARAIYVAEKERERTVMPAGEHYAEIARAAIAAMREPTEAMVERTAMQGESPAITAGGSRARIPHYWRLMIDEALK